MTLLCLLALCQSGLAETLTLPADLTEVEEEAFFGNARLESVLLPDGLQTIGPRAFAGCALKEVSLPATLTEIADDAFDGPDKLTVTTEKDCYAYRWAVKNGYIVTFTSAINSDGTLTITGYTGGETELVIPEAIGGRAVTAIGDGAFKNNTSLTSVTFPESGKLVRIGNEAFYGCSALKTRPDLPLGLREIGDRAFYNVPVRIQALPRSLTCIGEDVFNKCVYFRAYAGTYADAWVRRLMSQDDTLSLISLYTAYISVDRESAVKGETVTFRVLRTDEEIESWHWQRSFDGINWTDCEDAGANQLEYTLIASKETCNCDYRLLTTDFTGSYHSNTIGVGCLDDNCRINNAYVCGTDVSISWDMIWSGISYKVYMTGPNGTETVLAQNIQETFYDVTGLQPETTYTFRVEASDGNTTASSAPVTVTTQNYRTGTVYRALLVGQSHFRLKVDECLDSIGDLSPISEMLRSVTGPQGGAYSYVRKADLSSEEVHRAIQTTFADADEDDVSLFFIASHGLMEDDDDYAGALLAYNRNTKSDEYIRDSELAEWLSEIPGEVVVILAACSSGSMIYDDSMSSRGSDALDAMNAAAISAFRQKDEALDLNGDLWQFDEDGNAEQAPQMIPRVGALRKTKFHVITSSAHLEYSYAYSAVLNPHSKFTYGLTQGVGLSGAMPCDKNGDGLAAMNELAEYIDACDDPVNPYIQHVQIYPANSDYALFFRGE